jgi:23S rRNA (adenine2503-C2)-methyltransferase
VSTEVQILEEHVGVQNRRFVVGLADGARVEAVHYRGDTLCVSSQVGCAVACPFCASGAHGLARPLTEGELRGQVEAVEGRVGSRLRRITLSGVGEPLHNARHVEPFVAWCRSRQLPPSVTTSGGPLPRLARWLHDLPHNGLTLSCHAGTEAVRARTVPKGPALDPLFALLTEELPRLSRGRRRRVGLAYLVVDGLNDADAEIDAFRDRATPLGLDVHLYAYNPVPTSDHRPVSRARYEAIYERMRATGLRVRMSSRARVEANGGCGTLVALKPKARRSPSSRAC